MRKGVTLLMRRPSDADRPALRRRARSDIYEPPKSSKPSYPDSGTLSEWVDFYLEQSWPLFPVHAVESGQCACWLGSRCRNAGKHPITKNGFKAATTDRHVIVQWLDEWIGPNLGIPTGGPAQLVVIDVDPLHGGDRTLAELESRFGKLPRTFTVRTGSGGRHLYFSMLRVEPPIRNSAGLLGPGVDVRGEGGYVVAPPSVTVKGAYSVEVATALVPIPGWVVDLLRSSKLPSKASIGRHWSSIGATPLVLTAHAAPGNLDEAVLNMVRAIEGTRNNTLNGLAYWAGRRLARGLLNRDEVIVRLTVAAELSGLDDYEIEQTLLSALDAGIEEG
jgi:hypothetical protein